MHKGYCLEEIDRFWSNFRAIIGQTMVFKSYLPDYVDVYKHNTERNIEGLSKKGIPDEQLPFIKNFFKEQLDENINGLPSIIYPMSLVYTITHFEVFFSNVTSLLLKYYWKQLKTNKKSLTYDEILSYESLESIKNKIIQKEIQGINRGSIKDKISYLEKQFDFEFDYGNSKRNKHPKLFLNEIIEIHSSRNLIIHNDSIVNDIYLKNNPQSNYKIGDKLVLDRSYTFKSLFHLSKACQAICEVSKIKLNK